MDRRLLALLPVAVLVLSVAGIAAAKDGALAALDTPIPPDAHPGTEIAVAWRAWMPDGGIQSTPIGPSLSARAPTPQLPQGRKSGLV